LIFKILVFQLFWLVAVPHALTSEVLHAFRICRRHSMELGLDMSRVVMKS